MQVFGILDYIYDWISFLEINYLYEIKIILSILAIIPVLFSVIALYFLMDAKIKGGYKLSEKYPIFIFNVNSFLSRIIKKEVLYNTYKNMFISQSLIFLALFILILIIF
jgi:hypothetical protein